MPLAQFPEDLVMMAKKPVPPGVLPPVPSHSVLPVPPVFPEPYVHEYQVQGETGRRTLWVVFFIMVVASLAKYVMAYRVPTSKRLFHVLTSFITTFAAISYFAMASGQGVLELVVDQWTESNGKGLPSTVHYVHRSVYWARYVDWSLTTPLLLLDLAFLAGLSGADILVVVVADLIMVLTGLFAALTEADGTSWGYYAIACLAYLVIVYQLAVQGREVVKSKDARTGQFFSAIGGFTLLLWTAYPIIWGLTEGSRLVNVDAEIIAYGVLDVLAKPVFGFWLLFTHDAMAASSLTLGGWWTHGLASEGALRVGDDEGA